ncbi:MAG TPA: MFS transporter [Streptosporangiaceae bacterium]|nr:MFS transporter [Streptosporangiaceae bacterium]
MSVTSVPSTSERSQAARPAGQRRGRPVAALILVLSAQLMVILDMTIVNVALPSIERGLHFSATSLSWVLNAYALTFGGLLLLGGRAGDILGRRRVFLTGIGLFTLASLAAGLATSPGLLIAARALQGVGGAIASPAALALVVSAFPEAGAGTGRWPCTRPSPAAAPRSAWCSAGSSPSGSRGAGRSSSTCRSGSPSRPAPRSC